MFLQEEFFLWGSRRHEGNTRLLPKGAAVLGPNGNGVLWPESSRCIIPSTGWCVLAPVPLLCSLLPDHCTEEKVRTQLWFSSICFRGRSRGNSAVPLFMHIHEQTHSAIWGHVDPFNVGAPHLCLACLPYCGALWPSCPVSKCGCPGGQRCLLAVSWGPFTGFLYLNKFVVLISWPVL